MKKIMIILLLLISNFCYGQSKRFNILPMVGSEVTYTGVVILDSVSASELYMRAKIWLAQTYKSSKDVIQVEDKDNGQIVGKGIVVATWQNTFYSSAKTDVHHTITIQVKDGRYRFEFTSLIIKYSYSDGKNFQTVEVPIMDWDKNQNRAENTKKYFTNINNEFTALIISLEKAMKKPSKSSDW